MKKGTIYRNLWAGHETYFVYQGSIPARGMRPATSYGYKLMLYEPEPPKEEREDADS